jgi:hypothetical protein
MKRWTPQTLYAAKPWILIGIGSVLCLGSFGLSLAEGDWSAWRGLSCGVGAAMAVGGGIIAQLRQQYRARSKWRRETPR